MSDPLSYKVVRFSKNNLFTALHNDRYAVSEVREHPQAKYIYRYLNDREMNAKIILIEYNYTDRDYLDDYVNYYARCFVDIPRRCTRLHFYSADLSVSEFRQRFIKMTKGGKDTRITKSYLGFVVARPLPVTIIGRSLLKPYPTDTNKGGRRKYCVVEGEKAHVLGVDFPLESLAFQEQDHTLAACATVSLWTCFHKSSSLFHTPMLTPAEITGKANEALQINRPVPSDGLQVAQINYAISSNGLVSETIDLKKNLYLRSLLYAYLHYGLPVILGLNCKESKSNHAIAVSGYSLDIKPGVPLVDEVPEMANKIAFTSSRIDRFFAHDDDMGPYSKLVIAPSDKPYEQVILDTSSDKRERRPFPKSAQPLDACAPPAEPKAISDPEIEDSPIDLWRIPEDRNGYSDAAKDQPLCFKPYVVIIPLYHKIRVKIQDIHHWIIQINGWLDEDDCLEDAPREFLEWDVYLTDIHELKHDFEKTLEKDQVKLSKKRLQRHPRFIWRATLKFKLDPILDLLGDATDIGGDANPFYDVVFYHRTLEQKFRKLFSVATRKKGVRVIHKQLDGFFFKYFSDNPA